MAQVTPPRRDAVLRLLGRALEQPLSIQRKSLRRIEWDISGDCQFPIFRELFGRADWYRSKTIVVANGKNAPAWAELWCRCRACDACRRYRTRLWRGRAMQEYAETVRAGGRLWMATYTMRPAEHVLRLERCRERCALQGCDFDGQPVDEQFRQLCSEFNEELTKYLKRVRKVSGVSFRYFMVMERHKSGFPHAHALIFELGATDPLRKKVLEEQWNLGFSRHVLVRDARGVSYVTKYLTKSSAARVRASLRFGQRPDPLGDRPEGEKADPRKKKTYAPKAPALGWLFTGSEHALEIPHQWTYQGNLIGFSRWHGSDGSPFCGAFGRSGRVPRLAPEHEAQQSRQVDTGCAPAVDETVNAGFQHAVGPASWSGVCDSSTEATPGRPRGSWCAEVYSRTEPCAPSVGSMAALRMAFCCQSVRWGSREEKRVLWSQLLWPHWRDHGGLALRQQPRGDLATSQCLELNELQFSGWPGPASRMVGEIPSRQESEWLAGDTGRRSAQRGVRSQRVPPATDRRNGAVPSDCSTEPTGPGRGETPPGTAEAAESRSGARHAPELRSRPSAETFPGDQPAAYTQTGPGPWSGCGFVAIAPDDVASTLDADGIRCPDPRDGTSALSAPHASWRTKDEAAAELVAGASARAEAGWFVRSASKANAQTRQLLRAGRPTERGAATRAARAASIQAACADRALFSTSTETARSEEQGEEITGAWLDPRSPWKAPKRHNGGC